MSGSIEQPGVAVGHDWYYAEGSERRGPVDDEGLAALVAEGRVTDGTLVWRKGLDGWMPYADAMALGPPLDGNVCSLCGRQPAEDAFIIVDDAIVCADCKPRYVQMMREGVAMPGTLRYAGFWIRFGAKLIDGLILGAVNIFFMVVQMFTAPATEENFGVFISVQMLMWALQVAIGAGYTTWFVGRFGATPGKMACRLRVVMPDGSPVSYWRAFGRYFGEMLSGFTLYIGYIIAAFDDQKRALHDHVCTTRVVHVE
jgi:uncharacterized RDD family membrane protein YckC